MSFSIASRAIALLSLLTISSAHTVITYPGWRGDNLHANGTVEETRGLNGWNPDSTTDLLYPYGMQWTYPCK